MTTHGAIRVSGSVEYLSQDEVIKTIQQRWVGEEMLMSQPLFHSRTIYLSLATAIIFRITMVFPQTLRPLSSSDISTLIRTSGDTAAFTSPASIQKLAYDEENLESLKVLKIVTHGGG